MATTELINVFIMLLVIGTSMFAETSVANKDWSFGFNHTSDWWTRPGCPPPLNKTQQQQQPKKIIVGGSQNWQFGFNYNNWTLNNSPFYLNDTLVFKYDAPNATTFPHSVYLFPNWWSFKNCDVKSAKMVANHTQGAGKGFEFVLKKWKPYYFACGEKNGFHCKVGQMKFAVMPMLRPFWSRP